MKLFKYKQIKEVGVNFFKNKDNNIVLAQWPNTSLIIWFVGLVVSKVATGNLHELASYVSFGALVVWAGFEIFSGVNYFRRTLGVVVLIFSLYSRVAG